MKQNYILLFCTLFVSIIKGQVCTPTITASSQSICYGDSVTLTASGATNYTWMPAGGNTSTLTEQLFSSTIYTLFAETGACASSATIQIQVNPVPIMSVFASPNAICAAGTASLYASGPVLSYSWSPSVNLNTTTSPVEAYPDSTTTYTVTGYDGTCYGVAQLTIYVFPSPNVTFYMQPDATPQVWNIYPNYGSNAGSYSFSWNWGDGSPDSNSPYPSHTYSAAGTYTICATVTDVNNGCYTDFCQAANVFKTSGINESSTMIQVNVINLITSIKTSETDNDISIFPNPSSEKVNINHPTDTELSAELLDVNGKLVISKKINYDSCIDVSTFTSGVYTLILRSETGSPITKKLIIVR